MREIRKIARGCRVDKLNPLARSKQRSWIRRISRWRTCSHKVGPDKNNEIILENYRFYWKKSILDFKYYALLCSCKHSQIMILPCYIYILFGWSKFRSSKLPSSLMNLVIRRNGRDQSSEWNSLFCQIQDTKWRLNNLHANHKHLTLRVSRLCSQANSSADRFLLSRFV